MYYAEAKAVFCCIFTLPLQENECKLISQNFCGTVAMCDVIETRNQIIETYVCGIFFAF